MMKLTSPRSQSGIVLVTAVVFLLMLTSVGVALLSSSNFGLKLSGAAAMMTESRQAALGAVDEVAQKGNEGEIKINKDSVTLSDLDLANIPPDDNYSVTVTVPGTNATLTILKDASGQPIGTCPRLEQSWDVSVIRCQSGRVTADHRFAGDRLEHPRTQAEGLMYQLYLDANNN
jgi:hypothetical protein